jgi:hypothetical protein
MSYPSKGGSMTDRELMQKALLKMEYMLNNGEWYEPEKTIEALRARLAQPEPEPVAWIKKDRSSIEVSIMSAEYMMREGFEPLYAAPPQREWQGLTDEEIYEAVENSNSVLVKDMARAIEAKLKEKNSG